MKTKTTIALVAARPHGRRGDRRLTQIGTVDSFEEAANSGGLFFHGWGESPHRRMTSVRNYEPASGA